MDWTDIHPQKPKVKRGEETQICRVNCGISISSRRQGISIMKGALVQGT
jgi:hypothetical protein